MSIKIYYKQVSQNPQQMKKQKQNKNKTKKKLKLFSSPVNLTWNANLKWQTCLLESSFDFKYED